MEDHIKSKEGRINDQLYMKNVYLQFNGKSYNRKFDLFQQNKLLHQKSKNSNASDIMILRLLIINTVDTRV